MVGQFCFILRTDGIQKNRMPRWTLFSWWVLILEIWCVVLIWWRECFLPKRGTLDCQFLTRSPSSSISSEPPGPSTSFCLHFPGGSDTFMWWCSRCVSRSHPPHPQFLLLSRVEYHEGGGLCFGYLCSQWWLALSRKYFWNEWMNECLGVLR